MSLRTKLSQALALSSIRSILFGALCVLTAMVVCTLGWRGVVAWNNYSIATDQKEFDRGGNRFITGLFEILLERLTTNNGLQAVEPADAATLAEIERRRKAVKENFDPGLAVLAQREFPEKIALLQGLKDALQKADAYRKRADEALKLPRDRRDENLRKTFIPVITDSVNAAMKVWYSALYGAAKNDPQLARLASIKEIGWRMREISGFERSNVASAIAAGTPIPPDRIIANADTRSRIDLLWQQLQNLTLEPATHPAIREAMRAAQEQYFRDFRLLVDEMRKAGEAGKYPMSAAQWGDKTTPQIGSLLEVLHAAATASEGITEAAINRAFNELVIDMSLVLLSILIAIASLWIVNARVSRPLSALSSIMGDLTNGRFELAVPGLGRKDEIGAMAASVEVFKNNMVETERLRAQQSETEKRAAEEKRAAMHKLASDFQSAVGGIIEKVSSASTELEAAANTLTHTAETSQQLAGMVASASEEASSNVQSVASASEEMAGSITEISRQVQESSSIAIEAVKQAEKTDARINELSQAANRIGDVVKLITAIAEQTNLLALNATIEAARAGEAGRGFAVVAQEVKALAAQTAKATDEISTQIAGMQTATAESVTAIKEIGGTIARISEIAATIAAAVEEQGAATQEIARNVQQASVGTSQVAQNIGDVNKGATETGSASSQVLSSAQSLSSESSRLKAEVDKFLNTVRAA